MGSMLFYFSRRMSGGGSTISSGGENGVIISNRHVLSLQQYKELWFLATALFKSPDSFTYGCIAPNNTSHARKDLAAKLRMM